MAIDVRMPKLGMTMEVGKIVEWKNEEKDNVNEGEILLVVETEKVLYEVESPGAGILHIIVAEEEEVPVGELIGRIAADQAEYAAVSEGKVAVAAGGGGVVAEPSPTPPVAADQPLPAAAERKPGERIKISPRAKKGAKEKGLDISLISGTGPGGRITEDDVLHYEKQQASVTVPEEIAAPMGEAGEKVRITPVAMKMAKEKGLDISVIPGTGPRGKITREDVLNFEVAEAPTREAVGIPASPEAEQVIKRTGMRRIIARKMLESTTEVAAQTYMSNSVDATAIQEYRKQLLPYAEKKANVRVTITDILMKITAFALKEHPIINSRYTEDGDILMGDVHMGMAMALAEGLIVPVIWNADKKSIIEIAKDRVSLIERGRAGKLTPDDIKGSTVTLSALGMYGIEAFAAIINQPENAILAVATIIDKPWVVDGQLTIRPIMNVNLTYDHRTIYGVDAAEFMATLKLFIENQLMVLA